MNKNRIKIVALVCATALAGLIVLVTQYVLSALALEIVVIYCSFKDINND